MRLFVAIDFPPEIKAKLITLKCDLPAATWVKSPALHLTLRFLGDGIEPIRLTPITTALRAVHAAPFSLALRGVGRFPAGNRRPARVLWVGVSPAPEIRALHTQIEQVLESVDFPSEASTFTPHVTLARLKGEGNVAQVGHFLEREAGFICEPFSVTEFHLMASRLTPQGAEYRREASFTLAH